MSPDASSFHFYNITVAVPVRKICSFTFKKKKDAVEEQVVANLWKKVCAILEYEINGLLFILFKTKSYRKLSYLGNCLNINLISRYLIKTIRYLHFKAYTSIFTVYLETVLKSIFWSSKLLFPHIHMSVTHNWSFM